ncbi:hypothetical protein K503DRAFT_836390, partial [Rhizopogon vinicolor AM-OR11-026]
SISSEEFRGQNVGISAEVALTDDQGGVVAVFEEWTGIHHVALAGKHNEHYITLSEDDAVDLARIAEGQWEDFPVFPQTPPRGNFTRMFRYFHDSMPVGEQEGQLLEEDWQERLAQRVEEESGGKLHVFGSLMSTVLPFPKSSASYITGANNGNVNPASDRRQ